MSSVSSSECSSNNKNNSYTNTSTSNKKTTKGGIDLISSVGGGCQFNQARILDMVETSNLQQLQQQQHNYGQQQMQHLMDSIVTNDTKDGSGRDGSTNSSSSDDDGLKKKITKKDVDDDHTDDVHKHDAHHAGPTWISLLASSVVCFIIYFVFCIVFSSVVWDPLNSSLDTNIDPPFGVPQGVGINLIGIAIGSVFFAWKSGCKAVMAGPDLLPIVFFAEAGVSVVTYLAATSVPLDGCEDDGSDAHNRFLGGSDEGTSNPCDAYHRNLAGDGVYLDETAISKVVPTTLVAMIIGNMLTAVVFYGLGKMKNTASVIGFIPASVVAGFLTCIGYKVIKLAVLITTGFSLKEKYIKNLGLDYDHINDPWLPLTIALIYGCVLYGLKRSHIVAAEKLILGFIGVPLVLFFVIVAITGVSMNHLRETNWFLTQARDGQGCISDCAFTRTDFWQSLQAAYGGIHSGLVAWGAIPRCIPLFIMGSCMTSLDSMLKLTSSEKALSIDLNYNDEMKLGGKATFVSSLFAGSPAYGQTKFNVINLSIARTSESPLPTLYLGAICLVVFLSGIAGNIINIMPRFLLGGLCVFGGVGFLYENLWVGRKDMNKASFAIVWIIFLVNFIWEFFILQNLPKTIQPMVPGLLVVFILGIILSTFEFMFAFMRKAKPPSISGGDVCCSTTVRSEKHDNQLAVMAPWFQVFAVESFIFFGTADNLYTQLNDHLAAQKVSKPKSERTKYLIFDLTGVTGIDSSAKDVFFKVHRLLKAEGINLVWAILHPKILSKFETWGLIQGAKQFVSLDLALRHVEDELLLRAHQLSEKWLVNKTVQNMYENQVLANVFNISVRAEERRFSSTRLMPWAKRITLSCGEEICNDDDDNLYMLYDGEVQVNERDGSQYSVFTGSFFNLDRLLTAIGALPGLPSTVGAVATKRTMLLVVSRKNFLAMQQVDSAMANKLLLTLLVQKESNRPGRVRMAYTRVGYTNDESLVNTDGKNSMMAQRLLNGEDYEISLTSAQVDRFGKVFDLILEPGASEVPMDKFASYVAMEARALGSALEHEQFMRMVDESGIDEDGDGSLSKDEFLTFLRGLFLSNIPSEALEPLRVAYEEAVAKAPKEPMGESRVKTLFAELGFDMKGSGMDDVIGVIDADGDGDVVFDEFMTGVGMMKKMLLISNQLDVAFKTYKDESKKIKRRATMETIKSNSTASQSCRQFSSVLNFVSSTRQSKQFSSVRNYVSSTRQSSMNSPSSFQASQGGLELDASDLQAFLKISREEAEEMVFLVDVEANEEGPMDEVQCHRRSIDREEFQQLIRNWS